MDQGKAKATEFLAGQDVILWGYDPKMSNAQFVEPDATKLLAAAASLIRARADHFGEAGSVDQSKVVVILEEAAETCAFYDEHADLARAQNIHLGLTRKGDLQDP